MNNESLRQKRQKRKGVYLFMLSSAQEASELNQYASFT